jgi:hypothetical protein
VEGVPCTPEPTDMAISYGDLITCAIDVAGESDVFRFLGSDGENAVLQVTSLGSFSPCMELVAPDNTRTVECGAAVSQRIDTTLNLTGTYTVLVSALIPSSGAYTFALQCLTGPCIIAPVPDVSGCIKLKGSPLANHRVILKQTTEPDQTTTTDANGCYEFENIVSGKRFDVIIEGPIAP